ncbi:hypothetical protein Tco_1221744 [Tanacetum coccineum]
MTAFSDDGLSVIATKHGTPLMLDSYTSNMCMQSWGRSSFTRAMIELRVDVELKDTIMVAIPKLVDECPKNIGSDVAKNLKNHRQAARGMSVGRKVGFKPVKQVYRPVSSKNIASTSGQKKQDAMSRKESGSKGSNSGGFPPDEGFFHVASSSISTTPIVERLDKLERQIIDGKLTLVDDDRNPLPKVVSMENANSDSEVEDVVNKHAGFMASTGLKRDNDSGYNTNSLLEQWRKTKRDDNYDPYDDDLYESHDKSDNLQAICDKQDITVRGRKKK